MGIISGMQVGLPLESNECNTSYQWNQGEKLYNHLDRWWKSIGEIQQPYTCILSSSAN